MPKRQKNVREIDEFLVIPEKYQELAIIIKRRDYIVYIFLFNVKKLNYGLNYLTNFDHTTLIILVAFELVSHAKYMLVSN